MNTVKFSSGGIATQRAAKIQANGDFDEESQRLLGEEKYGEKPQNIPYNNRTWLWVLTGVCGVLLVGLIFALVFGITRPSPPAMPQFMIPPVPPTKKMDDKTVVPYFVQPGETRILLGTEGVTYDIQFPENLSGYEHKDYYIVSNTTGGHTVRFANSPIKCNAGYSRTTWDPDRKYTVAKFDAEKGGVLIFTVTDCGTVSTLEPLRVKFCNDDLSECIHPERDVNAPWAEIGMALIQNLTITGDLKLSCPEEGYFLEVGAGKPYPTIKSAIDTWTRLRGCPKTTIKLSKGTYIDDPIVMDNGITAEQFQSNGRDFSNGLYIEGDDRAIVGHTYIQGHTSYTLGEETRYTITTNVPGVGPFTDGILAAFSTPPARPFSVTAEIALPTPADACSPVSTNLTGKIALAVRSTCFFQVTTANVEAAGGIHTIVYNTAGDPFLAVGPAAGSGLTLVVSTETGLSLMQAIQTSPTPVQITLSIGANLYDPPVGAPNGRVNISHPGGDLKKIKVEIVDPNTNMPLESPKFDDAGVVPGDTIATLSRLFRFGFIPYGDPYERTIASVSGNEITLTEDLVEPLSTNDLFFTIMPNVHVTQKKNGLTAQSALVMTRTSARIRGITLRPHPQSGFSQGFSLMSLMDSSVGLSNFVTYINATKGSSRAVAAINSYIHNTRGRGHLGGYPVTIMGDTILFKTSMEMEILISPFAHAPNFLIATSSSIDARYAVAGWSGVTFGNRGISGFICEDNGSINVYGKLDSYAHIGRSLELYDNSHLTVSSTASAYISGPNLWTLAGAQLHGALVIGDRSSTTFGGPLTIENAFAGVVAIDDSRFSSSSSVTFNSVSTEYLAYDSSKIKATRAETSIGNARRVNESGVIDHAFPAHLISGAGQTYSIDPAGTVTIFTLRNPSRSSDLLYLGRKFRLSNLDGGNNTVVLSSGSFVGAGVTAPGANNVYTFPNTPGHCLTLEVVSPDSVLVCGGGDSGTWSTAAKKKSESHEIMHIPSDPKYDEFRKQVFPYDPEASRDPFAVSG